MKKKFILLTAIMFGFATMTRAGTLTIKQNPAQHLTKSCKLNKR